MWLDRETAALKANWQCLERKASLPCYGSSPGLNGGRFPKMVCNSYTLSCLLPKVDMSLGERMKWSSCSASHQHELASQSSITWSSSLPGLHIPAELYLSAAAHLRRGFYKAQFSSEWILIYDCRKWWSAKIKHLHVSFPDGCDM